MSIPAFYVLGFVCFFHYKSLTLINLGHLCLLFKHLMGTIGQIIVLCAVDLVKMCSVVEFVRRILI